MPGRHKCRGICDGRADGIHGRYATGLRYCPTCTLSFRLLRRCPCCARALRRRARNPATRDKTHAPDTRIVVPPPRTRPPPKGGDLARQRNRESFRRYYWRDPDAERARRRQIYRDHIDEERAATRERATRRRRAEGVPPRRPLLMTPRAVEAREKKRRYMAHYRRVRGLQQGPLGRPRVHGRPPPESIR